MVMGSESDNKTNLLEDMESHGNKAWEALQAQDFGVAEAEYGKAIELSRQAGESANTAVYLSYLAVAKLESADLDKLWEAEAHINECIEIAVREGFVEIEAHGRLVLAETLRDAGKADRAIEKFLDALELASHINDHAGVELALGNLGRLYLERGWAEQASNCFMSALDVREETRDKPSLLGSLGLCMTELGNYEKAISHFRTAYLEAEFEEDLQAMAICRGSEGNTLYEIGSFQEALGCYEQAMRLSASAGDGRREGIWMGNVGTTWLKLGDVDKAKEWCGNACRIARQFDDRQSLAAHLDSLGDCAVAKGELNEAFEHYKEALELSEKTHDRLGERIYLTNLGKLNERIGQLQPAFDYLVKAVELFDAQRAMIKTDDLKTSFGNRGEDLYKNVVRVCLSMGKRVEALEYVGRAKSRALIDLLSNSPIDISHLAESEDQSLVKLVLKERELRSQIDHLERVFWQGESGSRGAMFATENAKQVYSEWRDVVNQLKGCHPNYATLISAPTLGFSEIKKLWGRQLQKDTAIIEYFWTDEYLMAASIIATETEPRVHVLADAESRDSLTMDLETFLEMSSTEGWEVPVSLCQRLYEALMKPVLDDAGDAIKRLILVPHGSLFHLPFAALHDGEGYLCQRFSFSYLPSTSLIPVLSTVQSKIGGTNYLVSAISDYSATRKDGLVFSSTLRSASGLDDLSYTMEEAHSVKQVGEKASNMDVKLLTNAEVKDNLQALFSQYSIVHFAGHAIFNPEEPMASGLVLSDGTVLTAASILERSALRTNCGRLLVLSACQTGVNLVTPGGEILGLARALMYAGMPNLVLSLWEVADRSTSDLMQEFHNTWQGGKLTIADALQKTQCEAVKRGQPVHAWAPFIHFGID